MTMTYTEAETFLAKGRNPDSHRRLARNTYVVKTTRGLGIKFHATVIVEFLADGRYVLNTGGWDTMTTKQRIHQFSPVRVGRIYNRVVAQPAGLVIQHPSDPLLPVKLRKCRVCKATGQSSWTCWGVRREYPIGDDGHCDWSHPTLLPCDHGHTSEHKLPQKCYRCKGTGQADYGSQSLPTPFVDGMVVDATGKVVDVMTLPSSTGYPPKKKSDGWYNNDNYYNPKPYYNPHPTTITNDTISGDIVVREINRLVPDAATKVKCPAVGCKDHKSVIDQIVHLNDTHRWTREQVADWLDTLSLDLSFATSDN